MIRKASLVAVAVALAAVFAFAQEGEKKSVKVTGYVIDNMCAGAHESKEEAAKEHSTHCALMASCSKSGFAVVAGDKSYKLDEQGNKLVAEVLKGTKTKKGLKVEVEGTVEGDTLHADKLAEVQ
jgi:hypothetical protein